MENISSGLTWSEVQAKFTEAGELSLVLNYVGRRAKKSLRNNDQKEERKLWRLFVQKFIIFLAAFEEQDKISAHLSRAFCFRLRCSERS